MAAPIRPAGDTVAVDAGSGRLYLPLVVNRDGVAQNWDSRFAIENMGGTTACATLVYTGNGTDSEVYRDPVPGAQAQAGCSKGGIAIPAGGTLFRSVLTMGVGPSFTGSVRVELVQNDQGTDSVAAVRRGDDRRLQHELASLRPAIPDLPAPIWGRHSSCR